MSEFDWRKFLTPSVRKIVIMLVIPFIVGMLITGRLENTIDFYGYLFTPVRMVYENEAIYRRVNPFFFWWIPLYLIACSLDYLIGKHVLTGHVN